MSERHVHGPDQMGWSEDCSVCMRGADNLRDMLAGVDSSEGQEVINRAMYDGNENPNDAVRAYIRWYFDDEREA